MVVRGTCSLFVVSALALCGCATSSDMQDTAQLDGSVAALGSDQVPTVKSAVARAIEYLPLEAKDDGCYARAQYIAMELEAVGIPTYQKFLTGTLEPKGAGVSWGWHVAPLVGELEPGQGPVIIDPALGDTSDPYFAPQEWTVAAAGCNSDVQSCRCADGQYSHCWNETKTVRSTVYNWSVAMRSQTDTLSDIEPTKEEAAREKFSTSWIRDGFQKLYCQLRLSNRPNDDRPAKLVARTQALLDALRSNGRLEEPEQFVPAQDPYVIGRVGCSNGRYPR